MQKLQYRTFTDMGRYNTTISRVMLPFLVAISVVMAADKALAIDSIDRKSTKSALSGTVTDVTRTEVVITTGLKKTEMRIPGNDVLRIRFDDEPRSLAQAWNFERTGQLDKALASYEEAFKEISASKDLLRKGVTFLIARTTAKQALAGEATYEAAIQRLNAFRSANSNHFRYFESTNLIARLLLASEKYDEAATEFGELGRAPWTDYQMAAQIGEARVLIETEKVDQALVKLDAVLANPAKEPAEQDRRFEALLVKTTCLQKQKNYDEAVSALDQIIAEVSADQTRLMAEAYLRQGDNYRLTGKTKEAVLAYLHVDILFPSERDLHAESLFQLSQLWGSVQHPDRAADAAARLRDEYPKSQWTQRLDTPAGAQ